MSKPIPSACPRCGGEVDVAASAGGRGTGDLTSYRADCAKCGMLVDHLGDTGRRDSAVRDYNRWAREYAEPVRSSSITVQGGYYGFGSKSTTAALMPSKSLAADLPKALESKPSDSVRVPPRSDFTRGYFCAVSVLLRERGEADTFVRSLFSQGGDPAQADMLDIELFREHGLMA